jgi:hypothetical protein
MPAMTQDDDSKSSENNLLSSSNGWRRELTKKLRVSLKSFSAVFLQKPAHVLTRQSSDTFVTVV